jgi:hypothetical protein
MYDVDDHRIQQSTGSGGENFGYDGDSLVYHNLLYGADINNAMSTAAFYIWGPTGPVMEIDSNSPVAGALFKPIPLILTAAWWHEFRPSPDPVRPLKPTHFISMVPTSTTPTVS